MSEGAAGFLLAAVMLVLLGIMVKIAEGIGA